VKRTRTRSLLYVMRTTVNRSNLKAKPAFLLAGLFLFTLSPSIAADLKSFDKRLAEISRRLSKSVNKAIKGEEDRIAIVPFVSAGGGEKTLLGAHISQELEVGLREKGNLRVMEYQQLETLLARKKLELSGLYDGSTVTSLGAFEGVTVLVMGTYEIGEKRVKIVAKLVDMETGEQKESARVYVKISHVPEAYLKEARQKAKPVDLENEKQRLLQKLESLEADLRKKKQNQAIRRKVERLEAALAGGELSLALLRKTDDEITSVESLTLAYDYQYGLEGRGKNLELAAEYYTLALEATPDDTAVRSRLGQVYQSMGDVDNALAEYQMVLDVEPDSPGVHQSLGLLLYENGDYERAAQMYVVALEKDPVNPRLRLALGEALRASGKRQEAIQQFLAVLRIRPKDSQTHMHLGITYQEQGETVLARRHLSMAIRGYRARLKNAPSDIDAYFNLGLAHEKRGDIQMAAQNFRKYLDLEDRPGKSRTILQAKDAFRRLGSSAEPY